MKQQKFIIVAISTLLLFVLINVAYCGVLWMDTFDDGKINPRYEFKDHPGEWIVEDGVLKQISPSPGDHAYCLINGGFAEPHTVIVKVRIDDWEDHDLSRAGIGVRLDPGNGAGYAFLIHHTLGNMEFLNDHLTWKNNDTKPPFDVVEVGEWYWMKAEISNKEFLGKIWPENEPEPAKWLLESGLDFGAVRPESGIVGLNGGSNAGSGRTNVSFDNFAVCETSDECTPAIFSAAVAPKGKIALTWGAIKN